MKSRAAAKPTVRVNVDTLADALTAVWPADAGQPPCTLTLATAVIQHLTLEERRARPSFNVTHLAYLRDAATDEGLLRGRDHHVMSALSRQGLVQYEGRRWTATPKGLEWLKQQDDPS